MKIKLISLELKNFKGIKEQLINFGDNTQISGDNGTGKSSIFDSFCWLLFGKDSTDAKNFNIQTLDENNNIIHHLEHSVIGVLEIDGVRKTFKRTLKEKWQKEKGAEERKLNGCPTIYEIDDVPLKEKDYKQNIDEILQDNMFKLLTNPLYFPNMRWKEQRQILLDIIGDLDEESVINYNSKLKPLLAMLEGKNIEDFNEKVKFKIKKLKDKVKDIPARIDENNSFICTEDFTELEKQKVAFQNDINVIDEQIADSSKANEGKLVLQEELFRLKDKLSVLRNDALKNANKPLNEVQEKINNIKSEIQKFEFKTTSTQSSIKNTEKYISSLKLDVENTKNRKQQLLNDYHKENDIPFNFDDSLVSCPACGREYDIEKIEEIKTDAESKFNVAKKKTLNYICSKGKPLADDIEKNEEKIRDSEVDLTNWNGDIEVLATQKTELETKLSELEYQKQKID